MFEKLSALKALNFFDLKIDCYKLASKTRLLNKKYLLKSFCSLLNEEEFAKVYMGWNEKGLFFLFDVKNIVSRVNLNHRQSDSVEIFIDTRSLKTKGYITKFCHHFVFFPEVIDGIFGKEITQFRSDDTHPLCSSKDLIVDSMVKPRSYILNIEIPYFCLFAFNPKEVNYLSFTYRINRPNMPPQHFCISSIEHSIEKSPHLWATISFSE